MSAAMNIPRPPPLPRFPKRRAAPVLVFADLRDVADDDETTAIDSRPPNVLDPAQPAPLHSDVRALKGVAPTPPRPAVKKASVPPPLPADIFVPLEGASPPAKPEVAADAEPVPSTEPTGAPAVVAVADKAATAETLDAAPASDPLPRPSTVEILPAPVPLRPSRMLVATTFARTTAFFVAYLALAAFEWTRAGALAAAKRLRKRVEAEWTRASVRARFPGLR